MYNLLKKMGFNPNTISSKPLKNEFYALISSLLNNYKLYGKPEKKDIYKTDDPIPEEERNLNFLVNLCKYRKYEKIIDLNKKSKIIHGINLNNNMQYLFEVIYDSNSKCYTINCYPKDQSSFLKKDFSESFSIVYDLDSETLTSQKLYKDSDNKLNQEIHTYSFMEENNNIMLISTYSTFDTSNIESIEEQYLSLNKKITDIYIPGDSLVINHLPLKQGISSISSNSDEPIREFVPINESCISMIVTQTDVTIVSRYHQNGTFENTKTYKAKRSKKALLLNEIIAVADYKEKLIEKAKMKGKKFNITC